MSVYGGCGVEGCTDCRPLYDEHNQPIPGTDSIDSPPPGPYVARRDTYQRDRFRVYDLVGAGWGDDGIYPTREAAQAAADKLNEADR